MNLNPSQKAVANARAKRTLAVSGAGTGKTASCTHWVAGLVADGISPSNILMLTFTRKAGEEMRKRARGLIEKLGVNASGAEGLTVGNYHSIAVKLLRQDPAGFGLKDGRFTILDTDDTERLWKSALKAVGIEKPAGPWVPSKMAAAVSRCLNWCRNPETHFTTVFKNSGEQRAAIQAYRNFISMKEATNCVDFDDLLVKWARRLKQDPAWKEKMRERWQYVLVDEFQDNNPLNAEIIRRLNPHHLLVVGDCNQSIYAFRGANPKMMDEFAREDPGTVVLKLEDNYRSGQNILDLANTIVAESVMPLVLNGGRGTSGRVEYRVYDSPKAEADQAVEWVKELLLRRVAPAEICILSRSSFPFVPIEIGLKHRRINYKKYGGLTLGDSAEVKDFMAFLRVVHNPRDRAAWMRAMVQFPKMGEAGAMKFLQNYPSGEVPDHAWPPATHRMRDWIKEIRGRERLGDKLEFLANKIPDLIESNYKDNFVERIVNLKTIALEEKHGNRTLSDFLDSFSTDKFGDKEHPNNHITISTVHSAKGLEWNYVWLLGTGSLQMPHVRSKTPDEHQEERRLAYVAVTRARDVLVCSYSHTLYNGTEQEPSPFLPKDLPWIFYDSNGNPLKYQPTRVHVREFHSLKI
jgi:DNA helicase-2/ATP-dependent DNA helicase PcrA